MERHKSFARGSATDLEIMTEGSERRAVIYSRISERTRWMENELARSGTPCVSARSVAQLVIMMVGNLADHPRAQLLVVDLDSLSAGELFHLHRIREQGWGGRLFALGKVPLSLRASLGIDRTIPPPYVEDLLCEEIVQHVQDSTATTVPIPIPML